MTKIRAIVKVNEYTNTYYHRDFEVVDEIPQIGNEYEGRPVVKVAEVRIDPESRATELGEYEYYKVTTSYTELNMDDEEETFEYVYYVAHHYIDDIEDEEEED